MKRRLIKKSNGEFSYKFKSPIIVNYGDDFSFRAETNDLTNEDRDTVDLIRGAVNDSMSALGPKGLAEYLEKPYSEDIESIIVTVENKAAITIVKSNRELSKEELDDIAEYISGQFSDGWGEGFEQEILDTWKETSQDEVWDEEEQEIYYEDSEYDVTLSASFWNSSNWNITLI